MIPQTEPQLTTPAPDHEKITQGPAPGPTEGKPASVAQEPLFQKVNANGSGDKAETLPEWTSLSETMTEHDERLLNDWKDDLANLLIFAGLFSSVVTGFTAESYTWLQQDNTALSVQLLGQISMQLASFSVSGGFINSTMLPVPLDTLSAPSPPAELYVRINTLWFLSLAISVTASLMAIIVQQWLREYRLPGHLSVRERVRLRQYRYDGLFAWGVPQIISSLPILLQIALILFLTGLCYLLRSLDETVAVVFITFVGIALSAYFAFMVLPIAFRQCPYKNPVAHGLAIVTIYARIIVGGLALKLFEYFVTSWAISQTPRLAQSGPDTEQLEGSINRWVEKVARFEAHFLKSVTGPYFMSRGHEYVTQRELFYLPNTLDRQALIWAPSGVPIAALPRYDCCLSELTAGDAFECVYAWAMQALHTTGSDSGRWRKDNSVAQPEPPSSVRHLAFASMNYAFANRFQGKLLQVLPSFPQYEQGEYKIGDCLCVLGMLRDIARIGAVNSEFCVAWSQKIMSIMIFEYTPGTGISMEFARNVVLYWYGLSGCLFDACVLSRSSLSQLEIVNLLKISQKTFGAVHTFVGEIPVMSILAIHPILATSAAALDAISRRPQTCLQYPELLEQCRVVLENVQNTVTLGKRGMVEVARNKPDYYGNQSLQVVVPASISICKSIVKLGEAGVLQTLPEGLEAFLSKLIEAYSVQIEYQEGVDVLTQFRDNISSVPTPVPFNEVEDIVQPAEPSAIIAANDAGKFSGHSFSDEAMSSATGNVQMPEPEPFYPSTDDLQQAMMPLPYLYPMGTDSPGTSDVHWTVPMGS